MKPCPSPGPMYKVRPPAPFVRPQSEPNLEGRAGEQRRRKLGLPSKGGRAKHSMQLLLRKPSGCVFTLVLVPTFRTESLRCDIACARQGLLHPRVWVGKDSNTRRHVRQTPSVGNRLAQEFPPGALARSVSPASPHENAPLARSARVSWLPANHSKGGPHRRCQAYPC